MGSIYKFNTSLLPDVLVLSLIVIVAVSTSLSAAAMSHEYLAVAIYVDLTFSVGLAHFLLGIRRGLLPMWTLVSVVAAGFFLANFLVPDTSLSGHVKLIPAGLMLVVEASVFGVLLLRLAKVRLGFRKSRERGGHFFDGIEAGILEAIPQFPALSSLVRVELELLSYAFLGFFQRAPKCALPSDRNPLFSHAKSTHWSLLASVFLCLSFVEAGIAHMVLMSNGYTFGALIAGVLHVYGVLWLVGDVHALRLRRTRFDDDHLVVEVGLRARAVVPYSAIRFVEPWDLGRNERETAAFVGVFGRPHLCIELFEEIEVRGFLGRKKWASTMALQVDQVDLFQSLLKSRM